MIVLISKRYNCIFIHIPKTAGTSIENVLRNNGRIVDTGSDHHTLQQYYDEGLLNSSYFRFTIVRNTFDRIYSLYAYMKAGDNGTKEGKKLQGMMPTNFRDFCYEYIKDGPRIDKIKKLQSQFDYITIDGAVAVDHIGRFSTLQEDYAYLKYKLGLEMDLPHTRINKHEHYTEHYTDELYSIVEDAYVDEIQYFNFRRGE